MAGDRPNRFHFEPIQLRLPVPGRSGQNSAESSWGNSQSAAGAFPEHTVPPVGSFSSSLSAGSGYRSDFLGQLGGNAHGVEAPGFSTPVGLAGTQLGPRVSAFSGGTPAPVSSGMAYHAISGSAFQFPSASVPRVGLQGVGSSGISTLAPSSGVQPSMLAPPLAGGSAFLGSSGINHYGEASSRPAQANQMLHGFASPGLANAVPLAGSQLGLAVPSLAGGTPALASSGNVGCAGVGSNVNQSLTSWAGGSERSPFSGDLPVVSGSRPLGLPSTHARAGSPFGVGLQAWLLWHSAGFRQSL